MSDSTRRPALPAVKVCRRRMSGNSGLIVGRFLRDREVPGSNPALTTGIFLSKKFITHLPLSIQVYKWVPVREISRGCILRLYANGRIMTQLSGGNVKRL
ncbi:hypothetical protein DPMN_174988 [Dreissena polymorpha]|uniref:Uncharacterized protein n=1 Tax=Dreissena polymorpha TaxID=45954 RepID=A0A9D4E872_DREPO|nr:hypothetical protein DPMN_174988 [Dreissena polymorpha]